MANQDVVKVGTSINIKRTDGRVHSAFVVRIDYVLKYVTVEWIEDEEPRGKDIDLATVLFLNPNLNIAQANETQTFENTQLIISEQGLNIKSQTKGVLQSQTKDVLQSLSTTAVQNVSSESKHNQKIVKRQACISASKHIPKLDTASLKYDSRKSMTPVALTGRPSNVVKEVEKIKINREVRRQRQAEEKAEKVAIMQLTPGNPHWELIKMIQDYRNGLNLKPLSDNDAVEDNLITVCIRKRPLNKKEVVRKEVDVITVPSKNQVIVHDPKNKVDLTKYLENQLFKFDYVFNEFCTNEIVYKYSAQPLLGTVFEGGFATCFAYGQTGAGKTHTMVGKVSGRNNDCGSGIYAMVARDVFALANSKKYKHYNFAISASFFEIYSGKVFDLLNNKAKLKILEDGKQQVQVVGLTEKVVTAVDQVLNMIHKGNISRTSGQTAANPNSSRSHAIFQISLKTTKPTPRVHGKFSLIDLAGNERGVDTSSANRQTRLEGAEINKSLLALKECIRALGRKGSHLPFRVSKLTQVLKDSFIGSNSKTCMIAMISPGISSCEHSLNTLRYADRVKELIGGDVATCQENEEYESDKLSDDGLLQLKSLNETGMTSEMLNFHQLIVQLQTSEDNMLENHKQTLEYMVRAAKEANHLLTTTNSATYDQEEYCIAWEQLLSNSLNVLAEARGLVKDFRRKLVEEELLSKKNSSK